MTILSEISQGAPEQTFEGYSKVKIIKNSKGINVEVYASGKDYQNLDNIKNKALAIFNELNNQLQGGVNMNQEENQKLPAGTWDRLTTEDFEKLPKIKFEVNIPVIVEFKEEGPKEMVGQDGGIYYMFNVIANGADSIIQTSAWTLLRGLKRLGNLKGKKVTIVKKLNKGKQSIEAMLM